MILKNHASAPVRKEKLSPTSKARREAKRNKFVKKDGQSDRVEHINISFDRSKNCPRTRLRFNKSIQNGLGKVKKLDRE